MVAPGSLQQDIISSEPEERFYEDALIYIQLCVQKRCDGIRQLNL